MENKRAYYKPNYLIWKPLVTAWSSKRNVYISYITYLRIKYNVYIWNTLDRLENVPRPRKDPFDWTMASSQTRLRNKVRHFLEKESERRKGRSRAYYWIDRNAERITGPDRRLVRNTRSRTRNCVLETASLASWSSWLDRWEWVCYKRCIIEKLHATHHRLRMNDPRPGRLTIVLRAIFRTNDDSVVNDVCKVCVYGRDIDIAYFEVDYAGDRVFRVKVWRRYWILWKIFHPKRLTHCVTFGSMYSIYFNAAGFFDEESVSVFLSHMCICLCILNWVI